MSQITYVSPNKLSYFLDKLKGKFAAISHAHVISNVDGLQSALDGKETAGAAASALDDAKAYTDTKISSLNTGNLDMNLITVEDIDAICGATIQMASEVTF